MTMVKFCGIASVCTEASHSLQPPHEGGEKVNKQYVDNVREMLRRKGLADKYEYPGIYCIKLNGQIVYIGKS